MKKNENLEEIYRKKIVMIDTCVCAENEEGLKNFILKSLPALKITGAKIHIAYKVIEELGKICRNLSKEPYKRASAAAALQIFNKLKQLDMLDVRGQHEDSFADSAMIQNIIRYFVKYDILLITQDRGLASDAKMINNFKSVKSKKTVSVKNLDRNGNFIEIK